MELAVLLTLLGAARAFSSCHSLDLEAARRKRIEAVRGQILSKLRLTSPPSDPPPGSTFPIPEEIRALYNSTQELLQQRARSLPHEDPQEYYAKELHRIPMEPPGEGPWHPTPRSSIFVFNASRLRAALGPWALLHRAELRMLRRPQEGPPELQRLELYQGFGNASWRYLQGRQVQVAGQEEWLWFDVTEVVQQWLRGTEPLGLFKLSVHCPCEQDPGTPPQDMKVTIEGFEQQRGDMQSIAQKHRRVPYVLAMSLPPERANELHSPRQRRALDASYCFGSEERNCCLRPLWIDFRRDLQWRWIHEPRGYMANLCLGPCPYIWSSDTHYSKVLALYNQHNPGASAAPCCVPQTLDPLPIVYYVGRKVRVEQLSNMVVRTCKCS